MWEQVLNTPKFNRSHPRSMSLPTYRDNNTRELDHDVITADLRKIADEHV